MNNFTKFLPLIAVLAPGMVSAQTAGISKVYDYLPAPGQFVNTLPNPGENPTAESAIEAANDALTNNKMITLGAYGGYVVFGFDHPVANVKGEYDFRVKGNAFAGSNEAGIVMVSVDVNGNGVPDDEWYELAGSEYNAEGSLKNFTVGYMLPEDDTNAEGYEWASTDPDNASGMVKRNNFHKQSYWPAWISDDTMQFTGTRLPNYATVSGTKWTLDQFEFGYADNQPNNTDPGLKIDWAVNADGTPVELDHIDFVKVYTGSLQDCGQIGEVSTEVAGAEDLHLDAPVDEPELYVANFDNLPLFEEDSWWYGDLASDEMIVESEFTSGSFKFNNLCMPEYDSWAFYGYSNVKTNEFDNNQNVAQQNRSQAGGAHSGSIFGVLYGADFMGINKATLIPDKDITIPGVYLCNSAWVNYAIHNPDGFTSDDKGFELGDWLKLTITGLKLDGTKTSLDVYLADYRDEDPSKWTSMDEWTWVDLSSLGAVHELRMGFDSTKKNAYGITTPTYVCLDDLGAKEPEGPSTIIPSLDANDTPEYQVNGLEIDTFGEEAQLFDISGRKVAQGLNLTAPTSGIYILRIGFSAIKIALR